MSELLAGGGQTGALVRSIDWSKTALGAVETWPAGLSTAVSLALGSTFPIAIVWGPGHVQIYNDGYAPICSVKHPTSMGQDFRECWASAFPIIGASYDRAWAGEASYLENQRMFLERKGFLEEACFTFSFSPIRGESGQVAGLLNPVIETTAQMLSQRRTHALRDLAMRCGEAESVDGACDLVAQTLADYDRDLPFVLLYRLLDGGRTLHLAGSTGLRTGDGAASEHADVDSSHGKGWPFAESLASERGIKVEDVQDRFGAIECGPYPESPHSAFLLPIRLAGVEQPFGVLVAGVSPRLSLDDTYQDFYELLASAIAVSVGNARAYEAERRRAEELAEIDRAKTTFFSNVSHEFRTPLALMLGPLEDALASAERALHGESLEVTHRNTLRLMRLVNALLDFSRIEAGRVEATCEPVDLAATTVDLASVFRSAIERSGMKLLLRCEPQQDPVYVDREMWEKIVLNLVSNAFKFTFDGEIEVTLRQVSGHAELSVRDTGVGVSEHELPRLFERFHRIEGTKARTHEGSGIGLALVQELVRLHGGEIQATSVVGEGTTLTVRIPTGKAHLPADRIAPARPHTPTLARGGPFLEEALRWMPDEIHSSLEQLTAPPGAREHAGARILVVDDNADLRDYLRRILGTRWLVETAADSEQALAAARREPPALILTDVMMPGLTGFGLLRELRNDPRTRTIPVVMLSARAGEEARVEGLDAGADDYLVKPFGARELIARVSSQLTLSASRRETALLYGREQSARKEAELQKQHLVSLFTQAPTPIMILRGPQFLVQLANPRAHQLLGRTHDALVDRPLFEAMPELDGQVWRGLLEGVMATGLPHIGKETAGQVDRGTSGALDTIFFNFVFAPLRNVNDEVDGVLVFAFDVTDEVVAREQTERLRGEAETANRVKDEFLAMLGHELRNPLAPMVTALQLMRLRGTESREQDILERQVGHLTRLVDDLLDVSRITSGKIELRKQRIELADAAAQAIEISSPLLEQRRHHLDVRIPRRGLGVHVDPDRMAQVISNLLTNAAKYSEAGSKIIVEAARENDRVQIRVKDEGFGIASAMLATIFDSFVQQRQTLDRSKGGLGLGLTIVRSLVELHGGTVRAESAGVGEGSEFVIELPAIDLVAPEAKASAGRGVRARSVKSRGRRILVVDDNEDALESLKDVLEARGYIVAAAHDGPSALKAVETFSPDLALLDIGLPVMDGYELAKRLRALQRDSRKFHLVALTGYGQDSDRKRSADAGFERHLVKPIDLENLERVVEELCS